MKAFLVCVLFFIFPQVYAQYTNNKIVAGKTDSVYSRVLKENRKIWVYVPDHDTNTVSARQTYPVVYLLDGEARFYSVIHMIQQLSEVNGKIVIPKMIVVGIGNTDRTRDLTPTHVSAEPYFDSNLVRTSGGGENFTAFMEKELMPHIDSLYPTAPYRMLVGSSLGGLLTINTLINHTNLFNSYVAIDPYMQWDKQNLLKQAGKVLNRKKFNGKSLFLAIGNTLQKGWDTLTVMKDTSEGTQNIRSVFQLAAILKSNSSDGLDWSYKYYNDKGHNSVPLIAEYDAVNFIFGSYKLPSFQNMLDSAFNVDSAVTVHFENFSKKMGYTVQPPESLMNELGYAFMLRKMFDKAYYFFKMNIDNYPKSFTTYDNMGDFYYVKGDNGKAIEYYTKALSLRNFPDTRQKLERLKAGR